MRTTTIALALSAAALTGCDMGPKRGELVDSHHYLYTGIFHTQGYWDSYGQGDKHRADRAGAMNKAKHYSAINEGRPVVICQQYGDNPGFVYRLETCIGDENAGASSATGWFN